MTHHLVPGQPSYVVSCIHGKRTVITAQVQVMAIASALNRLRPVRGVLDCALYIAPIGSLFFTYDNGDVLAVQLGGPCNTASNGRRAVFLGQSSDQIVRLSREGA